MSGIVQRPTGSGKGAFSLLGGEHVQVAYVTSDIEEACSTFRAHYGVPDFHAIEADIPAGGKMSVRLAWAGGVMIELIAASGPGSEFYTKRLAPDGFSIRFHHLAYILEDEAAWATLHSEIEKRKLKIVLEGDAPGFMKFCYIEAEHLDHYLEYFLLEPSAIQLFETLPSA